MRTLSRPYVVVFTALFLITQGLTTSAIAADAESAGDAGEEPFVRAIAVEGLESVPAKRCWQR